MGFAFKWIVKGKKNGSKKKKNLLEDLIGILYLHNSKVAPQGSVACLVVVGYLSPPCDCQLWHAW